MMKTEKKSESVSKKIENYFSMSKDYNTVYNNVAKAFPQLDDGTATDDLWSEFLSAVNAEYVLKNNYIYKEV